MISWVLRVAHCFLGTLWTRPARGGEDFLISNYPTPINDAPQTKSSASFLLPSFFLHFSWIPAVCNRKRRYVLLPAAVFLAIRRATTGCVGGAAINLARSESTVLDADATCSSKGSAACRRAHFLAATAMLAARSFRCRLGGRAATAEGAEAKGAVFLAKSTSFSSCTTPCSSADFLPTMLRAHPAC